MNQHFDFEHVISSTPFYWRGERYIKSYKEEESSEDILECYESFNSGVPYKKSLKFLKPIFPEIYRLMVINKSLKIKDNWLYCYLQSLILRTVFFDLDLLQKMEDDKVFDVSLIKYFNRLFNTKGALYPNQEMITTILGKEQLPCRCSSEFILFLSTLVLCVDIIRDLTKSNDSITLEILNTKEYSIFLFKICVGTSFKKDLSRVRLNSFEVFNNILRAQFGVSDVSRNYNIFVENGILNFWLPWLQ